MAKMQLTSGRRYFNIYNSKRRTSEISDIEFQFHDKFERKSKYDNFLVGTNFSIFIFNILFIDGVRNFMNYEPTNDNFYN